MSALADLDWRYSRGETVDLRAIPIERGLGGIPENADDERTRLGRIDRRLRAVLHAAARDVCVADHERRCPTADCVAVSAPGSLLVWVLRAWHGGPRDLPPAERAVVSFGALLVGATTESDEARVIAVRRQHRDAKRALDAAKKTGAKGRAGRIDRGIAKRDLEEAAHVLRVVYGSPTARELGAARESWGKLPLAQQYRAMGALHAAAVAAYREAGA